MIEIYLNLANVNDLNSYKKTIAFTGILSIKRSSLFQEYF